MTKMISKYKAILFDMDGVIINTMPFHFHAWKQVFESIGIQVDTFEIYRREGEPGMVTLSEIITKYGKELTEEEKRQLLRQKELLFKKMVSPGLFPGIEILLEEIKQQGYFLGLVTGTSKNEMDFILPAKVHSLFDITVNGDSVKRGKPFPDPYLRALDLLNVKPAEAVVIENAPYGIQSAKRANISCIALTTSLPREYLQDADYICDSVDEVRELLSSFVLHV